MAEESKARQYLPLITLLVVSGAMFAGHFGVGDFLGGLGFPGNPVSGIVSGPPLGKQSFGWLLPTAIVFALASWRNWSSS